MEDAEARSSPANQSPTVPTESPTDFIHSPINYTAPSIRLVRIRSTKSSDGFIQCQMRHASTASTYLCLSYVWGVDDCHQWIFVNGQRLRIRQNLFNFLRVARQQREWRSHWFWIDAICIDQSNAIKRNHQVKQMGNIFAGAVQVVAWLGMHKPIATFLEDCNRWKELETAQGGPGLVGWSEEKIHDEFVWNFKDNADGFRYFCYADYWDRAWITQEVALASHITFMAGKASLAAESISFEYDESCQLRIAAMLPGTSEGLAGRSLIYLMDWFKSKKSGVIRDRVFSLLSLCGDGSDVLVDYNITDLQVAENVLYCCKRSLCLCAIGIVALVLDVKFELPTSQYALNAGLDFAHMTFPITMDHRQFHQDQSSSLVLLEPSKTGPILTLNVRSLCRSYYGRIQTSHDRTQNDFSVTYFNVHFVSERNVHLLEGCRMELLSNWQSCTAIFSLQSLYQIVQLNRSLVPCCERVAVEGTESARPFSQHNLTLCDGSHGTAMTQRRLREYEPTITPASYTTHTRGDTLRKRDVSHLQEARRLYFERLGPPKVPSIKPQVHFVEKG